MLSLRQMRRLRGKSLFPVHIAVMAVFFKSSQPDSNTLILYAASPWGEASQAMAARSDPRVAF
jgi:hypothetical protein